MQKIRRHEYDNVILWRGIHWTAALPNTVAVSIIAATAFLKYRFNIVFLDKIFPLSGQNEIIATSAEWILIFFILIVNIIYINKILSRKYILTKESVINMESGSKGQMILMNKIISCKLEEHPGRGKRTAYSRKGNVKIITSGGEFRLPSMENPDEFVSKLNSVCENSEAAVDKKRRELEAQIKQSNLAAIVQNITEEKKRLYEEKLSEGKKENKNENTVSNHLETLDNLIGLEKVKDQVRTLRNFITVQNLREKQCLPKNEISLHSVFTGNPGTGKTTIARIMAAIYHETGVLPSNKFIETDRSGLVAEYVGQTAVKTNKIIDEALGGVLFIDEAYSLTEGVHNDYGPEAVATLIKRMEDERGHLAIILAGYTENMHRFILSNPGLQSRFNRYIDFPDYSEDELEKIFRKLLDKQGYRISMEGSECLKYVIAKAVERKDRNFGNARFVRNLFESAIQNQADRIIVQNHISEKDERLCTLEDDDIIKAAKQTLL